MNNYRIDIFLASGAKRWDYKIEFPEFYLAKMFAERIAQETDVVSVFLLERISDNTFDVTRKIK